MQVSVIVQNESEDSFSAEPLGKPEMRVVAASETEALRRLTRSLCSWLESAKLIQLEVPLVDETTANPWLTSSGRSADDPDFEDFVAEMERARSADDLG